AATAARTPPRSRSRGTWTPIRPVAHGSTRAASASTSSATSAVAASVVRRPSRPVHAFALPAWTSTARARPAPTRTRAICTGAAGARFVVKTPAAVASRSATISATSRPRVFNPARTPAKRKPGTRTRCARRGSFILGSSRLAVALLVLLAAAARTRVVPPHLVAVPPDGLHLLRLLLALCLGRRAARGGVRERHARRRALAALHRLELRRERDVAVRM